MSGLVERARVIAREQGLAAVVRKGLRYPLKPLFVRGAVRALQRERHPEPDLEELFAFVNGFNHRGIDITSWQKQTEIVGLLGLLATSRPRSVVEIGTAGGGTLFLLTQIAADDATIVSVDLPGGRLGGSSSAMRHRYPRWRARLYRGFGRADQTMHVLRADSHQTDTMEEVRRRLPDGKADFIFIDGDHSYDGVRRDYELYSPLVREGGLVAFHDIVPGGPGSRMQGDPGEVPVFWAEIKQRERVVAELVEDWEWGSCGIGVVRL